MSDEMAEYEELCEILREFVNDDDDPPVCYGDGTAELYFVALSRRNPVTAFLTLDQVAGLEAALGRPIDRHRYIEDDLRLRGVDAGTA